MTNKKALVKDYMTENVISVSPDTLTDDVLKLMKESNHNSYPVEDNGKLVGMVSTYDLVVKDKTEKINGMMTTKLIVANENLSINDASRVMFRKGISRLPVVNKKNELKGIITNTDMMRSHIERSTPTKVSYFQKTMEQIYGIKTTRKLMLVKTNKIRPTQDRVYADELEGRSYELQRGLAEPVIIVKSGNRYILVDGHHRAMAARKLKYEEIDAYVIDLKQDIKLGMEKTADKSGIKTFNDIKIIDDANHPLIALTESIQESEKRRE